MRKRKMAVKMAALAMSGTLALAPVCARAEELSSTTEGGSSATEGASPATEGGSSATEGVSPATEGASPTGTGGEGASILPSLMSGSGTQALVPAEADKESPAKPEIPEENLEGTKIKFYEEGTAHLDLMPGVSESASKGDFTFTGRATEGDAGQEKNLQGEFSERFLGNNVPDYSKEPEKVAEEFKALKSKDFMMYGDLSISKEENGEGADSTELQPYAVKDGENYTIKAEYDVSTIHRGIETFGKFVDYKRYVNIPKNKVDDTDSGAVETELKASFSMGEGLDGSFHETEDPEEAKRYYSLIATDGHPLLYRINYEKSEFKKNKVILSMEMDPGDSAFKDNKTFGNFKELVSNSAKKMQLLLKGVQLKSATKLSKETEIAAEKTTVTEGTIHNSLVGYMHSDAYNDVYENRFYSGITGLNSDGSVRYTGWIRTSTDFNWGAVQGEAGRDSVAGKNSDKLALTVQFTNVEKKNLPNENTDPVRPTNGGNGGGGSVDRTPIIPAGNPEITPLSNPNTNSAEVLGASRPDSITKNTRDTEEKNGEVLGKSREEKKLLSARAMVSTGDKNFTVLWVSLFGLSVTALAGFVVLQRKKEEK